MARSGHETVKRDGVTREAKEGDTLHAKRIGLLGGSFNPAHDGHLHVSREALRLLELDEVWWLVSPQNPLKDTGQTAPLQERLAAARVVAHAEPRLHVTDIESRLGTQYTADTLRALLSGGADHLVPSPLGERAHRFVWLMGSDNLAQFDRWKDWEWIAQAIPIAVFARGTQAEPESALARRFAAAHLPVSDAARLADAAPPAWCYLPTALHLASSTAIRDGR